MTSLGIDIGGANLKVADNHGNFKLIYFPIWKKLDKLEYQLRMIRDEFDADKVGVVMTAELSDIFDTKVEGVLKIAKIVSRVFEDVFFLDLNGELRRYDDVLKKPRMFAASNWIASVKFLIEEGWKYFIFGDIGSTTTDLIPVTDKIEAGRTDYERLKNGELIYFGVLRTPVFYILPEYGVPLASEFFAISADVFVVTGDIKPEDYICDTPNGRGKDVKNCMKRLARAICCDLEEIGEEFVISMAKACKKKMIEKIMNNIKKIAKKFNISTVLGCGLGEFLLREASNLIGLRYVSLKEEYGEVTLVFPSYAMAKLIERK